MLLVRRFFYVVLGFSFPFFWFRHASGFMGILYKPLQKMFATDSVGWPSLVTALAVYFLAVLLFEMAMRVRGNITPEWHNRHQPPLFGHESFRQDHCREKEPDQPHPRESSADQGESAPGTDR